MQVDGTDADGVIDALDRVPEMPRPGQRWSVRWKAAVIEAVRGGWAIEEVCQLYNISIDEFVAWERDLDRNGIPGLRSTRYQIYRDTEIQGPRCQPNREPVTASPDRAVPSHLRGNT
jgi:Protein of unknown function (DUF1153)